MSANMFQQTAPYTGFGVRLWGLNKTPLLTGGALQEVHFDLCRDGSCDSFLPSNLRGTAPPLGAPNYFAQIAAPDTLNIYKFDADFVTPTNSTLTGPVSVPIAPFNGYSGVIPQPGTDVGLDTLSFRLMMQLQYRNFGDYQSLWATHTVDEGGLAVARWYEVRDPGGTPTLFQQGSLNPGDGVNRWMASIAADRDGNAAIGYSVSNSSVYPGIRYTGRLNGEIPGQMPQTETGAGQRHRLANQFLRRRSLRPLGRLQRDERGSHRRLHLLVHPGVLHRQRRKLADPHRFVQVPLLRPVQGHDYWQGG